MEKPQTQKLGIPPIGGWMHFVMHLVGWSSAVVGVSHIYRGTECSNPLPWWVLGFAFSVLLSSLVEYCSREWEARSRFEMSVAMSLSVLVWGCVGLRWVALETLCTASQQILLYVTIMGVLIALTGVGVIGGGLWALSVRMEDGDTETSSPTPVCAGPEVEMVSLESKPVKSAAPSERSKTRPPALQPIAVVLAASQESQADPNKLKKQRADAALDLERQLRLLLSHIEEPERERIIAFSLHRASPQDDGPRRAVWSDSDGLARPGASSPLSERSSRSLCVNGHLTSPKRPSRSPRAVSVPIEVPELTTVSIDEIIGTNSPLRLSANSYGRSAAGYGFVPRRSPRHPRTSGSSLDVHTARPHTTGTRFHNRAAMRRRRQGWATCGGCAWTCDETEDELLAAQEEATQQQQRVHENQKSHQSMPSQQHPSPLNATTTTTQLSQYNTKAPTHLPTSAVGPSSSTTPPPRRASLQFGHPPAGSGEGQNAVEWGDELLGLGLRDDVALLPHTYNHSRQTLNPPSLTPPSSVRSHAGFGHGLSSAASPVLPATSGTPPYLAPVSPA